MKKEVQECLENNILNFWITKMQDSENGGFYGEMCGNGALNKNSEKGGILNARILWTFSAAYRVLKKTEYLEMATYSFNYIKNYFWDKEFGGTFWSVDCKGAPLDTKKQFYALGFMLYGLSEYSRATGNKEALDMAIDLFFVIEKYSWDLSFGGYVEALSRDWHELSDVRLSDKDRNYPKSQNTHLHIIEPYTNLYRIWKHPLLENALRRLLNIFTKKILNPETYHLDLFFNNDWSRMPEHWESYGHDIECSWLMHETALVLGDKDLLSEVESIVKKVAKASEKGLNLDGSMIHEANFTTGEIDDDLHWWVQAETVVGFANLYQHFGDVNAAEKSLHCWEYIKNNLIDNELGEWYWSRDKNGNINRKDDHAGFWKTPYHNGRMCLEIIERF